MFFSLGQYNKICPLWLQFCEDHAHVHCAMCITHIFRNAHALIEFVFSNSSFISSLCKLIAICRAHPPCSHGLVIARAFLTHTCQFPCTWVSDAPFAGLGIRSFNPSIFNLSIFSIFKKDRPWLNRSCWSFSKDRFDHFQDRVDRSITKNDRFICFWQFSPLLCQKIESLPSIFDLFKRLTWSIRSCRSFSRLNRSIDLSITKDDRFDQKTDDRISNPDLLQSLLNMFGNSYYTCASCTSFGIPPA